MIPRPQQKGRTGWQLWRVLRAGLFPAMRAIASVASACLPLTSTNLASFALMLALLLATVPAAAQIENLPLVQPTVRKPNVILLGALDSLAVAAIEHTFLGLSQLHQ